MGASEAFVKQRTNRAGQSGRQVKFDKSGLIPAVVQDDVTGEILMMAYMNRLALDMTLAPKLDGIRESGPERS